MVLLLCCALLLVYCCPPRYSTRAKQQPQNVKTAEYRVVGCGDAERFTGHTYGNTSRVKRRLRDQSSKKRVPRQRENYSGSHRFILRVWDETFHEQEPELCGSKMYFEVRKLRQSPRKGFPPLSRFFLNQGRIVTVPWPFELAATARGLAASESSCTHTRSVPRPRYGRPRHIFKSSHSPISRNVAGLRLL